ncbi:SDR family oxidoreductase [Novosphingobium colocasiae]
MYSATKAAVAALARGWSKDLAPRKILVNTVQPGSIDTDMNPADDEFAPQAIGLIPLARFGSAEEIAGAVAFFSPARMRPTLQVRRSTSMAAWQPDSRKLTAPSCKLPPLFQPGRGRCLS